MRICAAWRTRGAFFCDGAARSIADLYVWTMEAGLHGASAADMFEGYCRRLVEGDIALHVGEVLYGNVGAQDRLDFTVIGPAVNEASRIEKMCDALGRRILASERFARQADLCGGRLTPLGTHRSRGIAGAQTIYGLVDDAPATPR